MKNATIFSAALLALCAVPSSMSAAEEEDVSVKIVETKDSTDLYLQMHQNAPHIYHIPDVPRFALLGKERKFYMGIGANIKTTASYDFGNPIPSANAFVTSQIPMHTEPGNGAEYNFNAQTSNVYLNVVALPGTPDQLGAYVSVNFRGNNYAPALHHAYLKYRGILAGYTFSIFTDIVACPATIDFEGPNALGAMKGGIIAYERVLGKDNGWKAGIGLDMPKVSFTQSSSTELVTQRIPSVPFYIQRNWSGGHGWLRLSGLVRNLYYRDMQNGRNVDKVGWGIKASGTTPIYAGLSACYQAIYGKGIANYIQDLTGCGMDLMPDPDKQGALKAVEAWGAFGSLTYRFSPSVYCNAVYSHVRTYADKFSGGSQSWGDSYKYAQYVTANVFWKVNGIVQLGAEYIYGRRVNYDDSQAHDNRIQAMLQVSF